MDQNINLNQPTGASENSAGGQQDASHAVVQINRDFKEKALENRAKELGMDYINLEKIPINPDLLYIVSRDEVKKSKIFPFFRIGKKLRLALIDPENEETKKILKLE